MTDGGFPYSDIHGSKPACGSPWLFAAYHVLHRLLVPRHSPYALSSLTLNCFDILASAASLLRVVQSAYWSIASFTMLVVPCIHPKSLRNFSGSVLRNLRSLVFLVTRF